MQLTMRVVLIVCGHTYAKALPALKLRQTGTAGKRKEFMY